MRASLCLGLLSTLLIPAKAAETLKKRDINLDDLARLKRVSAPVLSPDGEWILYTVSQIDAKDDKSQSHLWMVKWDGSVNLQLTYGKEGAAGSPKFSPDGKYISFLSSRPGPAKGNQVWVMDRRGGEAEQLTAITDRNIEGYSWSPDSKKLLLTMRPKLEPEAEEGKPPAPPKPIVIDRYHFMQDVQGYIRDDEWNTLYLYDIATKKAEKLTTDKNVNENEPVWSPDGKWIAYVSNHDPDPDRSTNTDVFIVEPKPDSTPRKLTTWDGPDNGPLAWSPDSQLIAYIQGAPIKLLEYSQSKPAVVTLEGKVSYPAAKLDRAVREPVFSPDGKHLSYLVNDDRDQYPAEVELKGDGDKRELDRQGTVMAWVGEAGHRAVLFTDDADPGEIYALENGELRKLTTQNDALIAELNLVPTENVEWKSKDGTDVHGLLTKPADFKAGSPVPMILFIHGGPNSQDEHSFDFMRQWLATKGYAELNVNYRGSSGRGQDYAKAIAADWGHYEVEDILSGVDKVVAMGVVDPNRMCVTGWSYGGILTDYTTASTDRFKCAISGAGVAAPMSFYGVDQYILQYDNELGPPWKNLQLYIKMSYPFLEVEKRIHTPMLFMGGTADMNVPLIGGEQMYEALKSLGRPTELVVYPGQFHGFTKPSYIKDRYERWLAWWDKYTKPAAVEPKKGE
ncbi:MAG TPA: S9 family peptidase [Terracidiphilus sp.]|nr:S9 family peptidase [Terracidiphilus sp.]